MQDVICTTNLTRMYGKTKALDNMTVSIGKNKIIGLIGRNGAGKTTFMKTCVGYIKPTSGNIKLWNQKVWDNIDVLSDLIFLDEEIQYDSKLKLKDIIFICENSYKNWDKEFAQKLLSYFNLDLKKRYKSLSRGMKTQFNIAVALASRTKLLLLDEPTLGLDAAVRKEFYEILLNDYIENPRTIIVSSHLLSEIEDMLEEIILIDNGKLILHESIDDVRARGIMLNGAKEILEPFTDERKVLTKQEMGNSWIVGILNNLSDEEYDYLQENNVDISPINAQDICVYLTNDNKGGFYDYE
jgi:ABC-2 type transport system ATP-binding protein